MMNKISIKKKLIIYSFFIQLVILLFFSFSLYKALEISTLDKMQTTLKVITLDIVDDILEEKSNLNNKSFDEEKEYKFEPLYIKLSKINGDLKSIISTTYPEKIKTNLKDIKNLEKNIITFQTQDSYIISRIKIELESKQYLLEVATNYIFIDSTLENLLYILLTIVPIILIFSMIGGYFLIYQSFSPIEKILNDLKNINASDLSKRLVRLNIKNDEIDFLIKEINSLLERLELSFEKVSQFSSDVSHELKTPLTIIRGELEITLRKDRDTTQYKQTLKTCLDEILIIQQTVEDLLFLAKSDNSFKNEKNEIYLEELTLESITELKNYAKLKNISIKSEIKNAFQIDGYPQLLKIAIKNIIKNAINFSHNNSEIKITNYEDELFYIISIQDKGIGIPLKEQKKVFEKFYRTDKSRNKDSGGTGLGLAICKKIINMHNALIELHSKENIGTNVYLKFNKPML